MDSPGEDVDIKLQRISGDLISDFDRSLRPLLYHHPQKAQQEKPQPGRNTDDIERDQPCLRSHVRVRETERIVYSLLDPFQELPQLLDPHLPQWLPLLGDALLSQLAPHARRNHQDDQDDPEKRQLLMPLSNAIARILYTFCKIRGEKVVVRFLRVETRYLELLLSALEDAKQGAWTWEKRYVLLLWLSHLLLVPFDLASMSSSAAADDEEADGGDGLPVIEGFQWPSTAVPGITRRVLPLAIQYLASPGKERDAARMLLVRISNRRDMQQLGLLDALVRWALTALRPREDDEKAAYYCLGVLSYLAGILSLSVATSDLAHHLADIFNTVHGLATCSEASDGKTIVSSGVGHKIMMIKILRSITLSVLHKSKRDTTSLEFVETTIGHLLDTLADNETPVRFAASKALGIVTLRLNADMASQVIEAVLESFNRNVGWTKGRQEGDLSAVNSLEWHGLVLTLSHLLYRRSPPAEHLGDIMRALLLGLRFERRGPSGGSIGTNVRDAACFGAWAVARRYTTAELLAVPVSRVSPFISGDDTAPPSVLQLLATELVVAATLDPAGNIRRGASAALQELVGRHPETVAQGIWLVQTVDYHAVARRWRATREVALAAAKLSPDQYGAAILRALLKWRGVGDGNAMSRSCAAVSYGKIAAVLGGLRALVEMLLAEMRQLQVRQVEERHGLWLSLAAVFDEVPRMMKACSEELDAMVQTGLRAVEEILKECKEKTYRRPDLVAEATGRLVVAAFPLLQTSVLVGASTTAMADGRTTPFTLLSGTDMIRESTLNIQVFSQITTVLDAAITPAGLTSLTSPNILTNLTTLIRETLLPQLATRTEPEAVAALSEAALTLLLFLPGPDRHSLIQTWADAVRTGVTVSPFLRTSGSTATMNLLARGSAYAGALVRAYPVSTHPDVIVDAFKTRWAGSGADVDTRVALLRSLTLTLGSNRLDSDVLLLRKHSEAFLPLLGEAMDDYTMNARGDVGSHVRVQGIRAVKALYGGLADKMTAIEDGLVLRLLRLAAEKLDRVRVEAQECLFLVLQDSTASILRPTTSSSCSYFLTLLTTISSLSIPPSTALPALLAGLVSSADTGNEDLVIASRQALCKFCTLSSSNLSAVCQSLEQNLTKGQPDRVLVPSLEVIAFLFRLGLFTQCDSTDLDFTRLVGRVQRAGYKSGSLKKIEACVRLYAGIASLSSTSHETCEVQRREQGAAEARKRLGALLFHPWPRVRSMVVDELWTVFGEAEGKREILLGVDWGKADKTAIRKLAERLGLV